jgi:membrane protein DedA with SNARE-associated domain
MRPRGAAPVGRGYARLRPLAERYATIVPRDDRPRIVTVVAATIHVHFHLNFHLHVHFHRFHGASFDYGGLAIAALVSWIFGIGPGEPALIAAAVLAAKQRLDLSEVLVIAWMGANLGGVIGWLIGLKAGRTLIEAPGPFRNARRSALARGERIFHRATVIAVILTPSWLAGVHGVRWPVYLFANAVSAAIWAVGLGVGSYLIGPPVEDIFNDVGGVGLIIIAAVIVAGGLAEYVRRRIKTS